MPGLFAQPAPPTQNEHPLIPAPPAMWLTDYPNFTGGFPGAALRCDSATYVAIGHRSEFVGFSHRFSSDGVHGKSLF